MDRNLTIGIVASLLLHAVVGVWVKDLVPSLRPLPAEPAKQLVRTVQQQIELPKPKPPEPKPPEPPKPEEPKAEAKAPTPNEAPKPVATPRRAPQPKSDTPPPPNPPPPSNEPPPLVLSQTYGAGGEDGVAVQTGKEDVLGDPGVEATESNTRRRPASETVGKPSTGDDETEAPAVPGRKVEVVLAKPKVANCAGYVSWPSEAPPGGRVVTVQVLLDIGADGKVRKVRILRGAGEPFDAQAIRDIQRCPFEPGTRDGTPISTKVGFTVDFRPQS